MKKRDWKIALISAGTTLGVVFVVVLILRLCSFEIVYDPKVITNWDAVAGVAAWTGVIMSFIAILFAIWVPIRIARRQDKIALFEKRLECYCEVEKLLTCGEALENSEDKREIFSLLCSIFCDPNKETMESAQNELVDRLNSNQLILISGKFIFNSYSWEEAVGLCNAAGIMVENLHMEFPAVISNYTDELKTAKENFCNNCRIFKDKYKKFMEADLNLK